MRLLCVIPARIGSTRLPQKPLRRIAGIPLIRVVAERVLSFGLPATVVVATDDERVAAVVEGMNVEALPTDPGHRSGTERVAEVARHPRFRDRDVILNVQGDEPFLPPAAVRGALARVQSGDAIGTAAAPLAARHAGDPSRVKVQVNAAGHAMAFARSPLAATPGGRGFLQHAGLYAYSRAALLRWVEAAAVPEEQHESLEQLRPLALGLQIGVALLDRGSAPGVDTEDDLRLANRRWAATVPDHVLSGRPGETELRVS